MALENELKIRTVEKTSKKFKGMILIGWGLIIAGIVMVFRAHPTVSDDMSVAPVLLLLFGVILLIYAKLMAWWHHG